MGDGMKKPIAVIDLYCGMGGFTQGAIEAGATVILSCDFWKEAVEVHKTNHPGIPCWNIKLGTVSDYKLIKQIIDKYPNHHIHLHGSPPCQALSNASSTDASKGMPLILHFLDLVEKLKPDSWSMENVVPMRKKLPEGVPSVVLNSADFGVPQTRRRCIAGEGWLANPSYSKEEWVSVIQALPHLEEELITHLQGYSRTRPVMEKGKHTGVNTPRHPPDGCKTLDEPSFTVCAASMNLFSMDSGRANAKTTGINPKTGKKEGGSGYLTRSLDNPSYTIMSNPRKIVINTSGAGKSNSRRAKSVDTDINKPTKTLHNNRPTLRLIKLEALGSNSKRNQDRSICEPSKTICGSGNQVGARIFNHEEKPIKIRSLTIQETLTLQGFNPDYVLSTVKTMKSKWTMVGNAVCPPVAKAIIEGILNG